MITKTQVERMTFVQTADLLNSMIERIERIEARLEEFKRRQKYEDTFGAHQPERD